MRPRDQRQKDRSVEIYNELYLELEYDCESTPNELTRLADCISQKDHKFITDDEKILGNKEFLEEMQHINIIPKTKKDLGRPYMKKYIDHETRNEGKKDSSSLK